MLERSKNLLYSLQKLRTILPQTQLFSYEILNVVEAPYNQKWLICFYGFGQEATVFDKLNEVTCNRYCILAINLPYNSIWQKWSISSFNHEFSNLLVELNIIKYISISFSLGSRLNLCLTENSLTKIEHLICIAPDGIQANFWNNICTKTKAGNFLFKYFLVSTNFLPKIVEFAHRTSLPPKYLYVFALHNIRHRVSRLKLYSTWMSMRHFNPNLKKINDIIQNNKSRATFYLGKHDKIIKPNIQKRIQESIPCAQVILLDSGHDMLNENLFKLIAKQL